MRQICRRNMTLHYFLSGIWAVKITTSRVIGGVVEVYDLKNNEACRKINCYCADIFEFDTNIESRS